MEGIQRDAAVLAENPHCVVLRAAHHEGRAARPQLARAEELLQPAPVVLERLPQLLPRGRQRFLDPASEAIVPGDDVVDHFLDAIRVEAMLLFQCYDVVADGHTVHPPANVQGLLQQPFQLLLGRQLGGQPIQAQRIILAGMQRLVEGLDKLQLHEVEGPGHEHQDQPKHQAHDLRPLRIPHVPLQASEVGGQAGSDVRMVVVAIQGHGQAFKHIVVLLD
mmetsp:Transcript_75925/g.232385  ORF Transcript_75925/g.232385 Transcript_75925/m.232385 type:complete len:220 (+) Transcript_75925:1484-2143(+)